MSLQKLSSLVLTAAIVTSGAAAYAATLAYVTGELAGSVTLVDVDRGLRVQDISVGGAPVDVAAACDGRRVYVSDFSSRSLLVVDTETEGVVARWPVDDRPGRILVGPRCDRLYVGLESARAVAVVDVASGLVTERIAVDFEPQALATDTAGTLLYVTDRHGHGIRIIDLASSGSQGLIKLFPGSGPFDVAMDVTGASAFVADVDSNVISVIDTASRRVVATVQSGNNPAGLVLPGGSGAHVLAASSSDDTLNWTDVATARVTDTIGVGVWPVGIETDPSAGTAVVANFGSASVSLVDMASRQVKATVPVAPGPRGVAFIDAPERSPVLPSPTPAAQRADLAFLDTTDEHLYYVNLHTGESRNVLSVRRRVSAMAVARDGRMVYVVDAPNLLAVDPLGDRILDQVDIGFARHVALSADEQRLYAFKTSPAQLVIVSAPELAVETRINLDFEVERMLLSPSGTRLYMVVEEEESKHLVVFDLSSRSEVARITLPEGSPADFAVGDDDGFIYVPYFEGQLVVIDVERGGPRMVLPRVGDPSLLAVDLPVGGLLGFLVARDNYRLLSLTTHTFSPLQPLVEECIPRFGPTATGLQRDSRLAYITGRAHLCVIDVFTQSIVEMIDLNLDRLAGSPRDVVLAYLDKSCHGDCNGDGSVTVEEIVLAVSIALDTVDYDRCLAADEDGDSRVTVNEVIQSVQRALNGCD